MSLLDDVSIVVTPNGYKAGELYAVVPTEVEGTELLTNEDFTNGLTGWGTQIPSGQTVEVTSNQLHINYDSTGTQGSTGVYQSILTSGKRYTTTIDVVSVTGTFKVQVGSVSHAITTSGIKTFTNIASSSTIYVVRQSNSTSFEATINSVSVKEITGADMDVTRATAGTRVDENGLVNYAEILGSEEVTNGDYTEAGVGNVISQSGGVLVNDSNRLKITSDGSSGFSRGVWETNGSQGDSYIIKADVISTSGTVRFIDVSNNASSTDLVAGSTYERIVTLGSSGKQVGFGGLSDTSFEIILDNVSVKEVTRDNVPRIDYTGGGCPHILAEPQRTNNLTASQDLTYSFWNSINTETIVASTVLSPDGTTFGFKAIPSTSTSSHYVDYDWGYLSMPIGEVTYSIFVKPFGYTNFQLASSSGMLSRYQNFELTGDGVLGSGDVNGAKIEKIGDWYRCTITETSVSASPRVLNIATPSSGLGRNPSFTGNGTDGVLLWGAQIEEGTYPTSYIPNLSTTSGSTVTRNQDIFTRDGIGSLINSTEGVLFAEVSALVEVDTARRFITLNDGGASNNVVLRYEATGVITARYQVGGVAQCSIAFATTITNSHKIAFKYKVNDFALWIDGTEVGTDTSGSVLGADTINKISFDSGNGSFPFYGKVKQLQVYTTALTDAQLTSLTT